MSGLTIAINILSCLIFILIAVIASKKIRHIVGKIINFLLPVIGFLIMWGFTLLIMGLFIVLSIFLINLAWKKLHQIFPRLWTIGEILSVVGVFILIGLVMKLCDYLEKKYKINMKLKTLEQKPPLKTIVNIYRFIVKEYKILILILLLSCFIAYFKALWGISIAIFGFPIYLVIKFVVLKIRSKKKIFS